MDRRINLTADRSEQAPASEAEAGEQLSAALQDWQAMLDAIPTRTPPENTWVNRFEWWENRWDQHWNELDPSERPEAWSRLLKFIRETQSLAKKEKRLLKWLAERPRNIVDPEPQ